MRIWEVQSQEDLIFSSGKLVVAGSKSEEEAHENVRKVYEEIRDKGMLISAAART